MEHFGFARANSLADANTISSNWNDWLSAPIYSRSRLFGWNDAIGPGLHCFGRTLVRADPKDTMASKSSGLNLKHMAGNLDSKCVPSGRVPSPNQSPPRCRHADVRTARSSRVARAPRVDARRERRPSTALAPTNAADPPIPLVPPVAPAAGRPGPPRRSTRITSRRRMTPSAPGTTRTW